VCDLETSRIGAPYIYIYIYDISRLRVNSCCMYLFKYCYSYISRGTEENLKKNLSLMAVGIKVEICALKLPNPKKSWRQFWITHVTEGHISNVARKVGMLLFYRNKLCNRQINFVTVYTTQLMLTCFGLWFWPQVNSTQENRERIMIWKIQKIHNNSEWSSLYFM